MPAERAYVPKMPATLMTAEELLHTSIPDKRTELVKGVLVIREPAGDRHGRVTMNLTIRLGTHVERAAAGQLFAGRELSAPAFDWAGLDYIFGSDFTATNYHVNVKEAQ